MAKNYLSSLLHHLAVAARTLTKEEVEAVIKGRASIHIKIKHDEGLQKSNISALSRRREQPERAVKEAVESLRAMTTREAGITYLREKFLNKADLLRLAQALDIPVRPRDVREVMEDRIIDATIGFRLRSNAIQNRSDSNG
jgi:phosphoenolpyruvate-protein kinase (PTS system EI component)